MMTLVRWILGRVILGLDALTSPKSVVREEAAQRAVDEITASMSLYQFKTCPFCVKVRREIKVSWTWHLFLSKIQLSV